MFERSGLGERDFGAECGFKDRAKHNILRWFGHMDIEVTKRAYMSEVEKPDERYRQLFKWKNRLEESIIKREGGEG